VEIFDAITDAGKAFLEQSFFPFVGVCFFRPVGLWARDGAAEVVTLRQFVVYDQGPGTNPEDTNHHGRPWKQYDEAGMVALHAYDFKGQPLSKTRRVIKDTVVLSTMPTSIYRVAGSFRSTRWRGHTRLGRRTAMRWTIR
jgi:hypothetical protein